MKLTRFTPNRVLSSSSSTETLTCSFPPNTKTNNTTTAKKKKNSLYNRIAPLGDPNIPISPVLDQWVAERRSVSIVQLNAIAKQLKVLKRFKHALQISQWMNRRGYINLTPDIANRLDLISKVHGIEKAEEYFDNIPKGSKHFALYFTLLNCYAECNAVEKAELFMQQMRELGLVSSPRAYNILLSLYLRVGQYEKLDTLIEEMNKKGIRGDKYTLSNRLRAYADTSKISWMEKMLKRMEEDQAIVVDWICFAIVANGYIKAGLIDKAIEMLDKSLQLISGETGSVAYAHLLTLYAAAGSKEGCYRIWKIYKSRKVYNKAYRCMIGSLLKLDDIAGAEKILEEWESGDTSYDFRVPNLLISAYCENDLLKKGEMIVSKAIVTGKKPIASTWDILATGYIKANQIPKAVNAQRAAFLEQPGRKPNGDTLAACLAYLKQQGDDERTDEFMKLLGDPAHTSTDGFEELLDHICSYDDEAVSQYVDGLFGILEKVG